MSQPLEQKNTRSLLTWLPLVMLAGSVFFYILLRSHVLHMQGQQLQLKQDNIRRAYLSLPDRLPLHIQGEYEIVADPSAAVNISGRPRDTTIFFPGGGHEDFTILTSRQLIRGRAFLVTVYISSKEYNHLIVKVELAEFIIFVLLLACIVVINRKTFHRLWTPFYSTLGALRSYDIRRNPGPQLAEVTGIDEFDRMNGALNSLIDHVSQAYNHQKQFTENAAHELQTPLAIIRSKVELLMEGPFLTEDSAQLLGDISDANERLSQMNRNLLLLTRIDNRQFPGKQPISLSHLVDSQASYFREYYNEESIKIGMDISPDVRLTANPALIEILVNNLLRNAYVHNIRDGYVHILLRDDRLVIENSGPVLEGDPERLFDRFRKGREDSRTTGLGLALVRQICQLYQYDIQYSHHAGIHRLRLSFPSAGF